MASLHTSSGGVFVLAFRYPPGRQGRQFKRSLDTTSEAEARETKAIVERTIRLLKDGVLTLPANPTDDQLWLFLRSGGKIDRLPSLAKRIRMGDLCQRFLDTAAAGSYEDSTLATLLRHTNNLKGVLGERTWADEIGPAQLRTYIQAREQAPGIRGGKVKGDTIRKELETFRQLWTFASSEGFVSGENPIRQIKLPKKNRKPPFMAWEQIEAKVARGGLSEHAIAELWDCLFLREAEIAEFLDHVRKVSVDRRYPFIYPALAFCAYTGARRSEMFRCEIGDIDGSVMLREKKADTDSVFTFRRVPMHPSLKTILDSWLQGHPGGQLLFVKQNGNRLDDKTSREAFQAVTEESRWRVVRGYHILRHSFASNLARHGVPEHRIREYMGHHTEDMAQRYRHLFPEDTQSDIEKLNF